MLEFEQLHLEGVAAAYRYHLCGEDIEERDKLSKLEAGSWKPTATCAAATRVYHLSQLYSPGRNGAICCGALKPRKVFQKKRKCSRTPALRSHGRRLHWKCPKPTC